MKCCRSHKLLSLGLRPRIQAISLSNAPSQLVASAFILDPFRNGFGQTVVAPYSVRRRPKAPFSAPLDWSELNPALDPADFNMGNYQKRMKRADPWADFFKNRQSLKAATQRLRKL